MFRACAIVEQAHVDVLPSPLLSSVIDGCLERGIDVTAGGARYNLSGIQAIQVANVADSLAALEHGVFAGGIDRAALLAALRADFQGHDALRQRLVNKLPKFGNDDVRADAHGARWARWFAERLSERKNPRGGAYHMGLYTVSAHVPMGKNVGATPDGRRAREPLADGGCSPMYGRDRHGPTAVLNSVARLPFDVAGNGTLLNLKFLPDFFATQADLENFARFLRLFVRRGIHHAQFNVVRRADLEAARARPEEWRHLTIRVAGYTAYFTELAGDLQAEIIARTEHG